MPLWVPNLTIGQAQPKLAINSDGADLVTNSDFSEGKGGWTGGTWESDKEAPFSDYALKVVAETVLASCVPEEEVSLGGRTFVFCFFAKSATSAYAYIGNEKFTISGLGSSEYRERAVTKTFAHYRKTEEFDVRIETAGTLYLNGVHCYEVDTLATTMPNPTYENLKTVRELQPESITAFSVTDLVVGWRFHAFLKWVGLSESEQALAAAIKAAEIVVYWPHSDEEDCVSCRPSTSSQSLKYVFDCRMTVDDDSIMLEGLALQYVESIIIGGS